MGGTDVADAFAWGKAQIAPGAARGGDAVFISPGGSDGASYLYGLADFRSAQTISIPGNATKADFLAAAAIVDKAEFVYFPGGEQNAYAVWAGTPLMAAVQNVYTRGGVVSGTSAGELVMGSFVFDAIAAGISENVTPAVALADPFDPKISFTRHMLDFPPLADAITEAHFESIDRFGRLAMFLARQHTDNAIARTPKKVLGIAIDEDAAVVIDGQKQGKLIRNNTSGRAFLVVGGPPAIAQPGQRLSYPGLEVHRLDDPAQTFDFGKWCGTAPVYTVDVSQDAANPFGTESPYDRTGTTSPCP
jgi:putative intracellular protease/amidase